MAPKQDPLHSQLFKHLDAQPTLLQPLLEVNQAYFRLPTYFQAISNPEQR